MVITQRDVLANQTHFHVIGITIVMTFMHANYELNMLNIFFKNEQSLKGKFEFTGPNQIFKIIFI